VTDSRLTIVRHGAEAPPPVPGDTVITTDELKSWVRSGRLLANLGGFDEVRLLSDRVDALGRPLPAALAARLMSRGVCDATDTAGGRRALTMGLLARWAVDAAREPFQRRAFMAGIERDVAELEHAATSRPQPGARLHAQLPPLYLRADLSFGVKAGGSIGHTAGVINHLGDAAGPPIVVTSDRVPTVSPSIEAHTIAPEESFWNYQELPSFVMNRTVLRTVEGAMRARVPALIYQRYTVNGYAAVTLARRWRVPLVTEYNGSEVWVARHWGRPLRYEDLSARIERLNLKAAHLVSVVSKPLAEEVAALGVEPSRILVNPNGVEPSVYRPDIDATVIRSRLQLERHVVIGFIGTFGPWHGAEVLAEAVVAMLQADPGMRSRVRVLWIGDGGALPRVREILASGGAMGESVFTGLVPQAEGPQYLAACDIFASPHVPNPDGSRFFGSPTKLFEYMAMGRGIVASALDQIADVLDEDQTALLVPPGDRRALAAALHRLVEDEPLRTRLGARARRVVLERHTWREHVRRIIDALRASL
jgi:glycosyltransferase involved in cell wall biosynthesis